MITSPRSPHSPPPQVPFRGLVARGVSAGAVGALVLVTLPAAFTTSASAAPGDPGVPSDPTVLYVEDFENEPDHTNVALVDYTGETGMTYSADPFWADRASCNGFIIDRLSTRVPGDCAVDPVGADGYFNNLAALPNAIGQFNGVTDPDLNAAAASYTSGGTAANEILFQTETPLTLSSAGRFITFSVDAVAQNCGAPSDPLLRFYLVNGQGDEIPVSNTAISPCADPRAVDLDAPRGDGTPTQVRVGRFVADSSVLLQGNTLGILMRNEEGGGAGNDGAYDNIRVLDVSPQLDKDFAPIQSPLPTGTATDLTFTITNTTELAEKTGWGFVDSLATGLRVAGAATSTCDAATIDAAVGADTIAVTDGSLGTGDASCTVTVPVTSDRGGVFNNGPGNVTATGLSEPGSTTTEFVGPDPRYDLAMNKSSVSGPRATVGDNVRYRLQVTNRGPDAATAPIRVIDRLPRGLELRSASGNGWDCRVLLRVDRVSCVRLTPLAPHRKARPVIVVAKATRAAVGPVVNTARVSSPGGDTTTSNNSDSARVRVVRVPPPPSTGYRYIIRPHGAR